MSIFFNLGSLILGFLSWVVPALAIRNHKKGSVTRNYCLYSFGLCGISLIFQFLEIKNRVAISDFSAIMDTIGAISTSAIILVAVALILNLFAYKIIVYNK